MVSRSLLPVAASIAVTCTLFAILRWPLALLGLAGLNTIACFGFLVRGKQLVAILAGATALLLIATLFFTDWGLSSLKPTIRIAWWYLIAACVSEVVLLAYWILDILKSEKGAVEKKRQNYL